MAKAGERKIGRTCTYVRADGRYVPAVIRAIDPPASPAVDLEVYPLGSGQTFAGINEMTSPEQTNVWLPGSRHRY